MDAIPFRLAHPPLSNIAVSLGASPHAGAVLESVDPLSFIGLSVFPNVFSDSFGFAVDVLSLIGAAIWEYFEASALFVVALPMSFVNSIVVIDHHAESVPAAIDNLTIVCCLAVLFQF